jgi:hypothetical protein
MARLSIANFGQIDRVDVVFGDLTVLVGPQASGKSLVLQWLKTALDSSEIFHALKEAGHDVKEPSSLLDLIFGEGMSNAWSEDTRVTFDSRTVTPSTLLRKPPKKPGVLFYIPAHRALLLSEGWPSPFVKLNADTPVVARLFSQSLYERFSGRQAAPLFPVDRILKAQYRSLIDQAVFHGGRVDLDKKGLRYRLELTYGDATHLPFMTWTAGQREFTPLLLGLYGLLPPRKAKKHPSIDWVVIEEPEMGLHPQAIAVVMLVVLDLLWRGYRVAVSSHSTLVLDVLWAIRELQAAPLESNWRTLSSAFGIENPAAVQKVMEHALKCDYRVFFLRPDPDTQRITSYDISTLDPFSEQEDVADWGGLTGFSSRFGDIVRHAVSEYERTELMVGIE